MRVKKKKRKNDLETVEKKGKVTLKEERGTEECWRSQGCVFETDMQTDTQTDRQRKTEGQTESGRQREIEIQMERKTDILTA